MNSYISVSNPESYLYVTDNGAAICKYNDNIEDIKQNVYTSKVITDINLFEIGDQIILTVNDWESYPNGRIRLDMLFEDNYNVSANRYLGFAIRGKKDNGNKQYYYFKTARHNGKGSPVIKETWDKYDNPFQEKFKLIFTKISLIQTKITILNKNDILFYENIYDDSYGDHLDEITNIGVYMTGSTKASFSIEKKYIII